MTADAERVFRFDPEWRTTLFVAILVPLMAGLGVWQLQRGEEKEALSAAFDRRQAQAPAPLYRLWDRPAAELAYLPVRLRATFIPGAYFLLDNRIQEGKFGYEVLAVAQLAGREEPDQESYTENDDTGLVLVNRGWIAGDSSRLTLPDVPPLPGIHELIGHVYVAPGAPYLLAEQKLAGEWPQRLQAVEMDKLAPFLAKHYSERVFPYPVRLAQGTKAALSVRWQIINVSPAKHLGYAIQWFSMSAVLLMFYILRSTNVWQLMTGRRNTPNSSED